MDKSQQQHGNRTFHKAISMYYEPDTDETVFPIVNSAKNDLKRTLNTWEKTVLTLVLMGVLVMLFALVNDYNKFTGIEYLDSDIEGSNNSNTANLA